MGNINRQNTPGHVSQDGSNWVIGLTELFLPSGIRGQLYHPVPCNGPFLLGNCHPSPSVNTERCLAAILSPDSRVPGPPGTDAGCTAREQTSRAPGPCGKEAGVCYSPARRPRFSVPTCWRQGPPGLAEEAVNFLRAGQTHVPGHLHPPPPHFLITRSRSHLGDLGDRDPHKNRALRTLSSIS